jgi:hypothetical protein
MTKHPIISLSTAGLASLTDAEGVKKANPRLFIA